MDLFGYGLLVTFIVVLSDGLGTRNREWYTAHGHNLNFYVGHPTCCPPASFKKVQLFPCQVYKITFIKSFNELNHKDDKYRLSEKSKRSDLTGFGNEVAERSTCQVFRPKSFSEPL